MTIHDCEVQAFSAGGPGGQHQNTSNTGVRVIHHPSGARGESREERSQLLNKRAAFRRMVASKKFNVWLNRQIWFKGELPEQRVKKDMDPKNLRVEGKQHGRWVPIEQSDQYGTEHRG